MRAVGADLSLLGHMSRCDACATSSDWQTRSLSGGVPNWEHKTSERVFEHAEEFEKDRSKAERLVKGRHLAARGLKSGSAELDGRHFKAILDECEKHQIEDPSLGVDQLIDLVLA